MRYGRVLFLVLGSLVLLPRLAEAQSDPPNGYFESGDTCSYCANEQISWDFTAWGQYYYYIQPEQQPSVFYQFPYVNATNGNLWVYPNFDWQGNNYNVDYSDQGWSSDVLVPPNDQWTLQFEFQRFVYIPDSGDAWARFADKWTNTSGAQVNLDVNIQGYLALISRDITLAGEYVNTSDGDRNIEASDYWVVVDDEDGSGIPAIGFVWQGEGGTETADTSTLSDWGWGSWYQNTNFNDIPVADGETVTLLLYAIQNETRAGAEAIAQDLASGADSDMLDIGQVEDTLVNFLPGDPTGPRLISNGPYRCDEGGSIQLNISAIDRDGEGSVTWSWDFNGDGAYGDSPNVADPTIDCAAADGPSTIRAGIRLTDDEGLVEDRNLAVGVRNVPPVVTSIPPTTATTNTEYQYQITVTDIAADTFTYELDEGPAGMTISGSGLLRWTPPANGIGPDVPVQVIVSDDDGGEAEHAWIITMQGGPVVNPGGPYRVAEGDEIQLTITAFDPEDPDNPAAVSFAWDLDSDGVFDDSTEASVLWSAAGIDGPADGFVVHVVVSDGDYDVQADIPVQVTNAPPLFVSNPSPVATIDREWTYTVQAVDPGDDPFEITVDEDEIPLGMTFDPVTATFTWMPNEGHLLTGDPPGHYCFTITAEDEDRGRSRQDACLTISRNAAPPVPPIKYPDGSEPVHTPQPTIILDNVDDPDGDAVTYFIEADNNPCFCSAEHQTVTDTYPDGLPEGQLVTQWALPRPFNVDVSAGGHTTFYVRRWASDGLDISAQELSLFEYTPPEPDGDADADADADGDADDGGDRDDGAGCACRTTDAGGRGDMAGFLAGAALVGLVLARRRRRG